MFDKWNPEIRIILNFGKLKYETWVIQILGKWKPETWTIHICGPMTNNLDAKGNAEIQIIQFVWD